MWRIESARIVGALARMVGDVGRAEDFAQDALVAALERWPESGVPDNPYALQAAIAACHARARTHGETDWVRITALYDALVHVAPSPVVELNRAVAAARGGGRQRGYAE